VQDILPADIMYLVHYCLSKQEHISNTEITDNVESHNLPIHFIQFL